MTLIGYQWVPVIAGGSGSRTIPSNESEDEKELRLLRALSGSAEPIAEDTPISADWRIPRAEDRKAMEELRAAVLDQYRHPMTVATLKRIDAVLDAWKTLDQIAGLRIELRRHLGIALGLTGRSLVASGQEKDESTDWLHRFFRIYQWACYLGVDTSPSGQGKMFLLFEPIRRVIPVGWRHFRAVVEVNPDPGDTTFVGGFAVADWPDAVVINNQLLRLDPTLTAIHEAEHKFQVAEFAKDEKSISLGDQEFACYARTMMEIGARMEKADREGKPRDRQPHSLGDVFAGKAYLDQYVRKSHQRNGEPHIEGTFRLLPSSLGEIIEAMSLTQAQRQLTLDAMSVIAAKIGSRSTLGFFIRRTGPTPERQGSLSFEELTVFLRYFSYKVWMHRLMLYGDDAAAFNYLLLENILLPILKFVEAHASGELIRLAAESRYKRYYQEKLGYVPNFPDLAKIPWEDFTLETATKERNARAEEIRKQLLEELDQHYFPAFPRGEPWKQWTLQDWTRSRASRCTVLGWMLYFVGEETIDKAFAEHADILSPLIPASIRHDRFLIDYLPEEFRFWKLYALLRGLREYPDIPLASAQWLKDITGKTLQFEQNGEEFRRQAWQDLYDFNNRTADMYVFIRNRMFNGREFGLTTQGIRVINMGPEPERVSDQYRRGRAQVFQYEWQNGASGKRIKRDFHWNHGRSESRNFYGSDRFDRESYEDHPLYEEEKPHLQEFYRSLLPFMSRTHGPGQGMAIDEGVQFSMAEHDIGLTEDKESENYFWWREEQQIIRSAIDRLHAELRIDDLLQSLERLVARVTVDSPLEDKWLMHVAAGTLPYMFAKGYIDTENDRRATRRAFQLLFAAADKELVPAWHLDPWLSRYGRLVIDLMEDRIRQTKDNASMLPLVLGRLARLHMPSRTLVGTFLMDSLHDSSLSKFRGFVLHGLSILFEQEGLARDPSLILGNPANSLDGALRERFLQILLDDLAYRGDWTDRVDLLHTRAFRAWELLADLGDARAIEPMMRFYDECIQKGKLDPNSFDGPAWNPMAQVLARMPPLDIARIVVFTPDLYPLWRRWSTRLFAHGRWAEIISTLERESPRLGQAFQKVFSTAWSETPPKSDPDEPAAKVLFDPGIRYEENYYAILGLENNKADGAAVLTNYRMRMRQLHEDFVRHFDVQAIDHLLTELPKELFDALGNSSDRDFVDRWRQDGISALANPERTDLLIKGLLTVVSEAAGVLRDVHKRASYDAFSPYGAKPIAGRRTVFHMYSGLFLPAIPVLLGALWGPSAALVSGQCILLGGFLWMTSRLMGGFRIFDGNKMSYRRRAQAAA